MNTLAKCIDELKKDSPDIRYILGMLETYMELSTGQITPASVTVAPTVIRNLSSITGEEVTPLAVAYETGKVGKIT